MKILLIFAILIFGCSEEYEKQKICSPFRMTISDAIPVQFWVNGVETYNQKEVCGITPACFCQPFNCDDEIRIQIQGESTSSYTLSVIDTISQELVTHNFTQISSGIFELSFVLSDSEICDEQVRFIIYESTLSITESAQSAGYTQTVTANTDWSLTNDPTSVNISVGGGGGSATSETLYKALGPFVAGDTIDLETTVTVSGGGNLSIAIVSVVFLNSGLSAISSEIIYSGGFGNTSESNQLIVPSGAVYFSIIASTTFGVGGGNALFELTVFDESHQGAQSDCIDVKTSHDCSLLIRYVNSKNFADVDYSNLSPTAEFYLRIPAIFFHETNPTEEEDFETSGQTTVSLRQEIKVKRRLEIGYMPDYMHRKLLLVLAHQTVEIDGDEWVRRDPYEKVPPAQKRYPLKMANVLLTLQGYIKRNIL